MSFIPLTPDIAQEKTNAGQSIDLVGLRDLQIPVRLTKKITASANLSIFVSLEDKKTRGIHMSRLYLCLHESLSKNIANFSSLKKILLSAIKSQKNSSHSGKIHLESRWPVLRKALKSSLSGWREYPFFFELSYSKKQDSFKYIAGGEVLYSSTCPCSASLSRQIIKKDFEKAFYKKKLLAKEEALKYLSRPNFLSATPHAQKSAAFFKLQLGEKSKNSFSLLKLIDEMEKSLGTPVQTAVKREDEAEFAKLNARHLMFCEDAVRRLADLFKSKKIF